MTDAAARLTALLTAACAVVADDRHTEDCSRRDHFAIAQENMKRVGRRTRETIYAEALRTAPPCDCVYGLLAVAVAAYEEN
jgi:hypothetical protein